MGLAAAIKFFRKIVDKYVEIRYHNVCSRKCWNWQTGKTKDLVSVTTCGFKSHLPHLTLVNSEFTKVFSF